MASHEQENCAQNPEDERTVLIRTLNDRFRCSQQGGQVFLTPGIIAIDKGVPDIVRAVFEFDDFNADNDPYGQHDFGAIIFQGQKIFWKIDYYDNNLEYGSEDPADASVTSRVLTIMLASEY